MTQQNSEDGAHSQEILEFQNRAREIANDIAELDALILQKTALRENEKTFLQKFKERFSPALLPIKPGTYAIIKPSRKGNIVLAIYMGGVLCFMDKDKKKSVPMREEEDYVIFNERGNLDNASGFEHNAKWLVECLEEIDAQK